MKRYVSLLKLSGLLLFVPIVIYLLAVSDTVSLCREYKEVRDTADEQPIVAEIFEKNACAAPLLSNGMLLRQVTGWCWESNAMVEHYSPSELCREGRLSLVSARLDLVGDFISLLRVLSRVEEVHGIKISNVNFSVKKSGKSERTVLLEMELVQMEELEP